MREKTGIRKYVTVLRNLFIAFSIVVIPAFLACLSLAFCRFAAFYILAPAVGISYFVVYGLYAMRVSMGTVIAVETTDRVVHLRTRRKTFTYDLNGGCVAVSVYKNRFVCTFESENARDRFVFYRYVPFTPRYEEQFTAEEIGLFYPAIGDVEA
jgi:hypothetical protein